MRFKSRDTAWNRNHPGELPLTLRIQTEKRRNLFFSACMTDCSVLDPHGAVAQSGGTAAIVRNRDHRVLCIRVNAVQHFHHFAKSPVVLPDRRFVQNQDLGISMSVTVLVVNLESKAIILYLLEIPTGIHIRINGTSHSQMKIRRGIFLIKRRSNTGTIQIVAAILILNIQ